MTNFLLSLGCTLIAFSPSFTLLFLFTYPKAQLIIIVTTSAFFYLLSSLASSILNLPLILLNNNNGNNEDPNKWNAFYILPIGVLTQFIFRCLFVKLYHKVEHVIEESIHSHEVEEAERRERMQSSRTDQNRNPSNNQNSNEESTSETALLRLELNDISCSIAAGVGFSTMHTTLLFGTLLASESNRAKGTLYQPSCSIMPSLIQSAYMACWFSILDIVWMMITFYAMRRLDATSSSNTTRSEWSFQKGRVSGKSSLVFVVLTHLLASGCTSFNVILPANGCIVSLPLLTMVGFSVGIVAWLFWKDNFVPESQRQRIRQASHLD